MAQKLMRILRRPTTAIGMASLGVMAIIGWRISDARPDAESQWNAGMKALESGDHGSALEAAAALSKLPEGRDRSRVLFAQIALHRGDYGMVLDLLSANMARNELRRPVLASISEAAYRLGDLPAAHKSALIGVADFPDDAHFHRLLSGVYYDLGAMQHALNELDELSRLAQDDFRPHHLAAVIHSDFDHPEKAVYHARAALERSPPPEVGRDLYQLLTENLVKERRYDECLAVLSGAHLGPQSLLWRAECLAGLGRSNEALAAITIAESSATSDPRLLKLKARLLRDAGQSELAIPLLERAVEERPHDSELMYQLAQAYQEVGRAADGAAALDRFNRTRELRDRLTNLSQQADRDLTSAAVRADLARVCSELGLHELAETWQTAADACRVSQ